MKNAFFPVSNCAPNRLSDNHSTKIIDIYDKAAAVGCENVGQSYDLVSVISDFLRFRPKLPLLTVSNESHSYFISRCRCFRWVGSFQQSS